MASVAPATRAAAPGLTADLAGSQAFISYSRADRAFVRQLHEGVAGSEDDTARVWDVRRSSTVAVLPGDRNVSGARFVPGRGLAVATAGEDGGVRLWHLMPPPRTVLPAGPSGVSALAYGPDGRLAAGLGDGSMRLWGAGSAPPPALPHPGGAT